METKRNENWSTSLYRMSFCPGFAGTQFIFFLGTGTVLYFGFCMRVTLIRH